MLKNIGGFFGLSDSQSDNWKDMAERKVQDGEFGINIQKSKSDRRNEECKFVEDASKILLQIDKTQKMEEEEEAHETPRISSEHVSIESSVLAATTDEVPTCITDKRVSGQASHESYNPMYQDDDVEEKEEADTDQQRGRSIEELNTDADSSKTNKTEVLPSKASVREQTKIRSRWDNVYKLWQRYKNEGGGADVEKQHGNSKTDTGHFVRDSDERSASKSEPVSNVFIQSEVETKHYTVEELEGFSETQDHVDSEDVKVDIQSIETQKEGEPHINDVGIGEQDAEGTDEIQGSVDAEEIVTNDSIHSVKQDNRAEIGKITKSEIVVSSNEDNDRYDENAAKEGEKAETENDTDRVNEHSTKEGDEAETGEPSEQQNNQYTEEAEKVDKNAQSEADTVEKKDSSEKQESNYDTSKADDDKETDNVSTKKNDDKEDDQDRQSNKDSKKQGEEESEYDDEDSKESKINGKDTEPDNDSTKQDEEETEAASNKVEDEESEKKTEDSEGKQSQEDANEKDSSDDAKCSPRSENEIKTESTDNKKDFWKLSPQNLVYGRDAFKHYNFYVEIEKKMEKQKLLCQLECKMSQYDWKIQAIEDLIAAAKDYYTSPGSEGATRWRDLKRNVRKSSSHHIRRTEVRRKLAKIPEYRPFFTYMLITVQLVLFVVLCALGGISYVGLEPRLSLEEHVPTFRGLETVNKWTQPNIWIGPDHLYFIGMGAVFAPCMREDYGVQLTYSLRNYSQHIELGCCEMRFKNVAGTTTQGECSQMTGGVGEWRAGVPCGLRAVEDMSVKHVMKPCCVGLKGECRLLSHKHCIFLEGTFHQSGPEHCSQLSCLKSTCSLGNPTQSKEQPWLLDSPSQWWRLLLSLLYHHGIIQLVLISLFQLVLMTQIERSAGWLRVTVVYIVSGTTALLTSVIFDPYHSHVGGVGSIFGLLGVLTIELVQFWSAIKSPIIELIKILIAFVAFSFLGTLPYLNIFGMWTGYVFGVLSGVIVLPYITFGRRQLIVRIILLVIAVPMLVGLLVVLNHLFRKVQNLEHCEFCQMINCVAYTDTMCDTTLVQQ